MRKWLFVVGIIISSLVHADEKFDQLLKVAEQGDSRAQHSVAFSYFLAKNNEQSIKWYRRAASQQEERSLYDLGGFYHAGYGVDKSSVVGYALVSLVARKEIPNLDYAVVRPTTVELARERLDNMSRQMSDDQIIASKALAEQMLKPGNLLNALDKFLKAER